MFIPISLHILSILIFLIPKQTSFLHSRYYESNLLLTDNKYKLSSNYYAEQKLKKQTPTF